LEEVAQTIIQKVQKVKEDVLPVHVRLAWKMLYKPCNVVKQSHQVELVEEEKRVVDVERNRGASNEVGEAREDAALGRCDELNAVLTELAGELLRVKKGNGTEVEMKKLINECHAKVVAANHFGAEIWSFK
jgi:hypothetical protein